MPKGSFLIYSLLFVAVSFSLSATAALVPSIADYFDVSKQQAVKLTWLYMLPYSLVAFIWGPLSRSMTIKRLLAAAAIGFFLTTLLFSLSATIRQAFAYRFLMGCFASGFIPLVFITIGKSVASEKKAKYLGVFFALSTVASCCGVFLSAFTGWRIIYLIPAAVTFVVCLLIFLYLDEFDYRRKGFRLSYAETLKDKRALKLFFVIGLSSFLFHGLQQNLGVYLSQRFSLNQAAISTIFTIATACGILSRLIGGIVGESLGNIKITRIGLLSMSIFALFVTLTKSPAFIFFTVVLWGGGWALAHIALSAHLTQLPDAILRDASSINSSLRMGFGGLGALCAGLLSFSITGLQVFFLVVAAVCCILGISLQRLLIEKR